MRELERELSPTPTTLKPIAIVGRGPVGSSLAAAAEAGGVPAVLVSHEDARETASGATAALLCVPDEAIAHVAAEIAEAAQVPALVGHVSGATTLNALAAATAAGATPFSLHPLQTFPGPDTAIAGVPAATAATTTEGESFAVGLATVLGMRPFPVPEERRAAYHAAACIASNYLVALEESAVGLLEASGVRGGRELLAPLVLRTAENWAERGGDALTGPIARGDERTVDGHLAELAETAPELLPLYETLADRTRAIASQEAGV